jgi:hypothetical protein
MVMYVMTKFDKCIKLFLSNKVLNNIVYIWIVVSIRQLVKLTKTENKKQIN